MNRLTFHICLATALLMIGCGNINRDTVIGNESTELIVEDPDTVPEVTAREHPEGIVALLASYPDFIIGYEDNQVIFSDSTRLTYDDGREKDFPTLLDDSDVEDMFSMIYAVNNPPEYLADAGRSRSEALFKKMYGNSATAVQKNLVPVEWFGQSVKFTKINGAADSLRAVARELGAHPEFKKYLASSGTFYWRKVRGAKRQSAHSYGIAFDIAVPYSDYWLWKNPGATETAHISYANKIPEGIVEIFRRHGFIWGGAWYHFDTMHFEFRPEILHYADLVSIGSGQNPPSSCAESGR